MPKSRECSPEKCPIENPLNRPISPQIVHRTNIPNDSTLNNAPKNTQFSFPPAFTSSNNNSQAVDDQRHLATGGATDPFARQQEEESSLRRSQTAAGAPQTGSRGVTKMSNIIDSNDSSIVTDKVTATKMGVLYYLQTVREPIVDYQETRGIARNEEITFVTLITSLCTQAYTAAITILVMLWNLMPLVDGFVYFFRFVLDKIIDILQTDDMKEKAIKGTIFVGELTVTLFLIFLIMGLIFMPVYVLLAQLVSKIFSMIAW